MAKKVKTGSNKPKQKSKKETAKKKPAPAAKPKAKKQVKEKKVQAKKKVIVKKEKVKVKAAPAVSKPKAKKQVSESNKIITKKEMTVKKELKEKEKTTHVPPVKILPEKEDKKQGVSIDKKLKALFTLQQIDSKIDKIRIVRGELPLEVEDLEDEIAGLETRVTNYTEEMDSIKKEITVKQNAITECKAMIKKYESQKSNVRNNREYDSLAKEIEYQGLETQLCEKRIKEFKLLIDAKKESIDLSNKEIKELKNNLNVKKAELDDIIAETEKDEVKLRKKSEENQKYIEERLLTAYKRIRTNARNGLAVVKIERDACGGCFNKIPPQRQLDIKLHNKIIVCEYCGRILVDEEIVSGI